MGNVSKQAVSDYLDSMFLDILPPVVYEKPLYQAQDTVESGKQMQACLDPFTMMSLPWDMNQLCVSQQKILAAYLLLNLTIQLPSSTLKNYCLRQCQILNASSEGQWGC